MIQGIYTFVKAAFKNPMQVSTVFPSSKSLAQSMLDNVGLESSRNIVEIGVGTGAITKYLHQRIPSGAKYLGVEVNPEMTAYMKKQYPDLQFHTASANSLSDFIQPGSVDAVVSSLPWSIFPDELQTSIVSEVEQILAPGGKFVTLMYPNAAVYPRAKRAIKLFAKTFDEFEKADLVVQNIPPAFVFVGQKS